MQAILNHLTTNRFAAAMTGFLVTVLVRSSSAAVTITLTMAYTGWIDYTIATNTILFIQVFIGFVPFLAKLATSSFHSHRESTTTTAIALLRIVDELESLADSSYNVALVADRGNRKKIRIVDAAITDSPSYAAQVLEFAGFVGQLLLDTCSEQDPNRARELEQQINATRNQLKKSSRQRSRGDPPDEAAPPLKVQVAKTP